MSNFLKQYGVVQQLQHRNSYSGSWELSPTVRYFFGSVQRCSQKTSFWEHIGGRVDISSKKTMHFTSKLSRKCRHVYTRVMPVPYSTCMYMHRQLPKYPQEYKQWYTRTTFSLFQGIKLEEKWTNVRDAFIKSRNKKKKSGQGAEKNQALQMWAYNAVPAAIC